MTALPLAVPDSTREPSFKKHNTKMAYSLAGIAIVAIVGLLWNISLETANNSANSKNFLVIAEQSIEMNKQAMAMSKQNAETNKQTVTILAALEMRISNNETSIAVANAIEKERHGNRNQ